MISEPADARGRGGCELWVTKELKPNKRNVRLLHSEPELLLASLELPKCRCFVLIFHAPPECAGEQERLLWWQHCKSVVQESAVDTEVLVTMCDANARVGSVQSSWIGPMRPEKENQNGRQLHQMLEEFDQIASNTFFLQGGSSWTSSTGAQARIDYVAIPRQWASSLVVAGTHGEIVLGSGDFTDHKVVYAKVRMRAPGARTDLLRKPRVCDARAVVEGGCVIEQFREELAKAPEIPKWVALDAHAELLAKWLRIKSAEFFSIPARRPRKPWITRRTFALIAQKQPMLRELSVIKGELKRTLLRDCWAVWCSQKRGMRMATDGNFLFSCRRLRVAQLHRSVGCLSLRIRKKVKEDFASYTSDLSVEAQRAATRFDQSTLFNIVKRLKFKSSPSVPSVLLEDGKPASSHQEEQSRWLRHHAKQFGGSVLTEAQHAQSCKIERAAEQVMTAGNMSSVEILDQVAEVIAELPNRKAQGEDSVPNEILKAGGQPVCLQLAQLCSKANELAAVPLTWKGGLMVTIPKAGDLRDCSNHRAVQTASCVGKVYSKVLRRSLVPFFEKYARSDQHGGVKGRGTEIASLTARVLMRRFSKIGKSFAVLFVDARSAFYSLLLEQVLGAADQESALNKVLEKISDLFPDVLAQAAKHRAVERHELGTALQAAGLGDHFIRVLVNWHHRSWISVEVCEI